MLKLNQHFFKLRGSYFFLEIERRIALFQEKNKQAELFNLGIGDISQPIPPTINQALTLACQEMGTAGRFKGYGPSEGYLFLREKIAAFDYENLAISPDEIFVSDGAQNDMANFQELFSPKSKIGVPDPTYPVYLDSNVMAGRTKSLTKNGVYGNVTYLACNEENQFQPQTPSFPLGLIYLCFPNNPTGVSFDRASLEKWVCFAKENKALLLVDGAYCAYITSPNYPKSIYEIEGAKEVAVEFRTFSKSAGFTGLRCSYTVVPKNINIEGKSLHALWKRRQDTKFNGVAYPIQRAAEACFSQSGKKEVQELVSNYLHRANSLKKGLTKAGFTAYGGVDSPYVWCKTPEGLKSWDFFDQLLQKHQIVCLPGSGFGKEGENFVRFSGFAPPSAVEGFLCAI